jgi:hypothetical protein
MKKIFVTAVSNQRDLDKLYYQTSQENLRVDYETAYPVVHMLENNITSDDEIEVIAINLPDNPEENYDMLKEDIDRISQKFHVPIQLTQIARGLEETSTEHVALFKELLTSIEDCSVIFADLTYGTKPMPMVIAFALNWIGLIRKYSDIAQLIYGRVFWGELDEHGKKKAQLYDVTEIMTFMSISQQLAGMGGDNIEKAIFKLLNLSEEE